MDPRAPRSSGVTGAPDRTSPRPATRGQPLRIVHYLSEIVLAHGGVVRAVLDWCAALAAAGHNVRLLSFDDRDVPPEWRGGGAGLPRAVRLAWPRYPKAIRRLTPGGVAAARNELDGADALHLHGPWESTNVQLASLSRRRGVPYIVSTHGMLDDWTIAQSHFKKRLFLAFAARTMLDRAACVLCTASAERDQATRWFSNPRTEVLPLLFDLDPFRTRPDPRAAADLLAMAPGAGPLVLFLSRIHPKKGLEHLIDAIAALTSRGLDCRLAIAGSGEDTYVESLRSRIAQRGLADRCVLLGMVTGDPKYALFAASDVFVLPTSQENWGFVLLESLAAGTPVITTRAVDIWPELLASGGAIITNPDAGAVADAMATLLQDAERARAMGEAGRAWAMHALDPASVLGRYEDLYRSLRAPA